jgi:hypothetical protein
MQKEKARILQAEVEAMEGFRVAAEAPTAGKAQPAVLKMAFNAAMIRAMAALVV